VKQVTMNNHSSVGYHSKYHYNKRLKETFLTETGNVCSKHDNDWGTFDKVGFPLILASQYSKTINAPAISGNAIVNFLLKIGRKAQLWASW